MRLNSFFPELSWTLNYSVSVKKKCCTSHLNQRWNCLQQKLFIPYERLNLFLGVHLCVNVFLKSCVSYFPTTRLLTMHLVKGFWGLTLPDAAVTTSLQDLRHKAPSRAPLPALKCNLFVLLSFIWKKLKKNLLRRVFFLIFNLPDFQFVSFPVCLCFNFSTFLWFPYFSVCPILQRLNKLLFYSYFCPSLFFLFCYFVWFILLCFPSPLWRLGFFWVHSVEQAKAVKLVKMVPHKELLYYIKLDIRNVIGGFSRYLMLVHWKGQKSNKSWNGVNPEWKQIQHLATSIKSQTKCIGKFIFSVTRRSRSDARQWLSEWGYR